MSMHTWWVVLGLAGGEGASVFGHLTGRPTAGLVVFPVMVVATIAGGVALGPIAERSRFGTVLAGSALLAGVPMAANVLSFYGLSPFVVTRQVVGGAALEEMLLDARPAVFSVAGHAVEATPAETPGTADLVEHTPEVATADLVARVV